ncbi:mitogen-activated protein kinase kinase kinase 20-like [Rutidosis leptorrhynchoides]|uniref:mitogen-activated protein kinase kinase kinase 20-like n=1 Tax=Rutidosis leptorrhynchoides TaxID=125765 RepID=UPI003A98F97E
MKTNKRSLVDSNYVNEGNKKTKQEDLKIVQKNMYGDGVAWFRGEIIGKGSYGYVFKVNLKNPNYRYSLYPPIMAVKSAEMSVSYSIQKEKQIMDNVRGCPNVIKCYGDEITDDENNQMVYNMLLEYASGGTLADLIKKSNGKGLPEFDVKRYARSILRGVRYVHKKGYVHCDLKPENVMLVESSRTKGMLIAKIGDLGLAKRVKQVKKRNAGPVWRGTARYLSPEVVINGVQGQPADIWAVGCIVFEMLTGNSLLFPERNLSIDEIARRIRDYKELPFISSDVSEEAISFLKCCLSKKVMCRLTANMLLSHPFLKGLGDDVSEVDELQDEILDINAITSSPSAFDDEDELWSSSSSEEEVDVIEDQKITKVRFHEVHRLPVTVSKIC